MNSITMKEISRIQLSSIEHVVRFFDNQPERALKYFKLTDSNLLQIFQSNCTR